MSPAPGSELWQLLSSLLMIGLGWAREPSLAREMSKKVSWGDSGKGFRSTTSSLLWKLSDDDPILELLKPSLGDSWRDGVREEGKVITEITTQSHIIGEY